MLTKANSVKTRTEEAQIEEEIILAYNLMQMKEGNEQEKIKVMQDELNKRDLNATIIRNNLKLEGKYKGYKFEIDENNKEIKLTESSEHVSHDIIGSREDWNITQDGALGVYKGVIPSDGELSTPTVVDGIKVTSIDCLASGGPKESILYREDELDVDENYNAIYNKSIEKLYVSEGVVDVAAKSFAYCHGLIFVRLPETLDTLGSGVFYGCKNLEEIDFGSPVSYIGYDTFGGALLLD